MQAQLTMNDINAIQNIAFLLGRKENKSEKHKESADEGKGEKKQHPPLWKHLRFAVHN